MEDNNGRQIIGMAGEGTKKDIQKLQLASMYGEIKNKDSQVINEVSGTAVPTFITETLFNYESEVIEQIRKPMENVKAKWLKISCASIEELDNIKEKLKGIDFPSSVLLIPSTGVKISATLPQEFQIMKEIDDIVMETYRATIDVATKTMDQSIVSMYKTYGSGSGYKLIDSVVMPKGIGTLKMMNKLYDLYGGTALKRLPCDLVGRGYEKPSVYHDDFEFNYLMRRPLFITRLKYTKRISNRQKLYEERKRLGRKL